jgi:hypothetical protein
MIHRTDELSRDFAILTPAGQPVTTCSHLDMAQKAADRAGGGLTVVRRIVTVTYEPITERAAA